MKAFYTFLLLAICLMACQKQASLTQPHLVLNFSDSASRCGTIVDYYQLVSLTGDTSYYIRLQLTTGFQTKRVAKTDFAIAQYGLHYCFKQ